MVIICESQDDGKDEDLFLLQLYTQSLFLEHISDEPYDSRFVVSSHVLRSQFTTFEEPSREQR